MASVEKSNSRLPVLHQQISILYNQIHCYKISLLDAVETVLYCSRNVLAYIAE